jgi:hypothetical protein
MITAMAERDPEGTDRDVLSSLPRTRPTRRSAKRDAPGGRAPSRGAADAQRKAPRARPAAEVPPVRPVPPAGYATSRTPPPEDHGHRHGLLGTAVQAACEVAQLGLAVGTQALRGALGRLPRP